MPKKRLKVIERKLGREQALGQCYSGEGLIEIDPRQSHKEYLGTLCHECLHEIFREMPEAEVVRAEKILADLLWSQGYRKTLL